MDKVFIYTSYYYDFVIGELPNESDYKGTANVIGHLLDANISDIEVRNFIDSIENPKSTLTVEDIPDYFWKDSLLEKDKFYYHKELQITAPAPKWDEEFDFFLEMKINYNTKHILDYFIQMTNVRKEWIDTKKEIGSINYLLKEYKKFKFMEPVDFILHLIDYAVSSGRELNAIYDLRDLEIELAKYLEVDILNSKAQKKDIVIWRK